MRCWGKNWWTRISTNYQTNFHEMIERRASCTRRRSGVAWANRKCYPARLLLGFQTGQNPKSCRGWSRMWENFGLPTTFPQSVKKQPRRASVWVDQNPCPNLTRGKKFQMLFYALVHCLPHYARQFIILSFKFFSTTQIGPIGLIRWIGQIGRASTWCQLLAGVFSGQEQRPAVEAHPRAFFYFPFFGFGWIFLCQFLSHINTSNQRIRRICE